MSSTFCSLINLPVSQRLEQAIFHTRHSQGNAPSLPNSACGVHKTVFNGQWKQERHKCVCCLSLVKSLFPSFLQQMETSVGFPPLHASGSTETCLSVAYRFDTVKPLSSLNSLTVKSVTSSPQTSLSHSNTPLSLTASVGLIIPSHRSSLPSQRYPILHYMQVLLSA